jgi:hypothetical protein
MAEEHGGRPADMAELKPGESIRWTHFYPDGRTVERLGTVIDRAPRINATKFEGAQLINYWVIPDVPSTADLYRVIAVGKARSYLAVHGRYLDEASGGNQYAAKGSFFSSNYAGSPTGGLAARAVQKIHEWKKRS